MKESDSGSLLSMPKLRSTSRIPKLNWLLSSYDWPNAETQQLQTTHRGPSLIYIKDIAIITELHWMIRCVFANYSFKFCDDDLFRSTGVPERFGEN